ncbi:hypothetical protein [Maricaulis alexandrii]|uniref:hypothetical protein n=1 Tax=Maricaulis alexandrii TaxID=2570354 RepID=UPI001109AE9B|nr:hypothetical protein [Maricaulis alexandrii]
MRLRLAGLVGLPSRALAWSVIGGMLALVLLPLVLLASKLVTTQSLLSAAQGRQDGLVGRIAAQEAVLRDRVDEVQPSAEELATIRNAQRSRTEFEARMEAFTQAIETAEINLVRAGPLEEVELDEVWVEARYLLRLEGAADTLLTLLSAPEYADLAVSRFDVIARNPAGHVLLDIEFRLVSAGGLDDPAL